MSGILSDNVGRAGGLIKAASGGGSLTFISNTDISDAATYDFTAFTPDSAEHYVFYLQNLTPATDAVHLWCRTSADGGSSFDSSSSAYNWGGMIPTAIDSSDGSDSEIALTGESSSAGQIIGSAAGEEGICGMVYLFGPHTTSRTFVMSLFAANPSNDVMGPYHIAGHRNSAAAVDGFRLLFSSGNIESGTVTVYSISNS